VGDDLTPARRDGAETAGPRQTPATLDLVEHARLAINGVLGSLNPERGYENYFLTFFDVRPAYMIHFGSQVSGVLPKYLEAMPLLRVMSGSTQGQDLEDAMLRSVLDNTAEDGLIYDRATSDRPWNTGVGYGISGWNEDYANLAGNGRLLTGLLYYYQATGDDVWKQEAQRTAERMLELAVFKDEYAYYPNVGLGNDFSYPRISGWTHTDEPKVDFEGAEGMTTFYLSQPIRGFVRWYQQSGDERFLDISRRLTNFCMRRRFWGAPNDLEPLAGAERGHFWGQFHGKVATLRAFLDYALAADDYRVMEFVQDGYEYARHQGIHRLGVFPGSGDDTEGCTVADMVSLAVKLCESGIGSYWEDVDNYSRNGLLATQATDLDEMKRVSDAGRERPPNSPWGGDGDMRFTGYGGVLPGQETSERVLERAVGQFGHLGGARLLKPRLMHCCTANGAQALYHAWEGITRRSGAMAEVNLWLNRRSPWLDIASSLPHQGRLVLHNKGMQRIAIRVPAWVSRPALHCSVDGTAHDPEYVGDRILLSGLAGDEQIVIEVPTSVERIRYTVANLNQRAHGFGHGGPLEYQCELQANTVLTVGPAAAAPGGQHHDWYRVFQHEELRTPNTPTRELSSYVHGALIDW
jgi:hypothetical protein